MNLLFWIATFLGGLFCSFLWGRRTASDNEQRDQKPLKERIEDLENAIVDSVLQRGSLESHVKILEEISKGKSLKNNLVRIAKHLYQQTPLSGVALLVFNGEKNDCEEVIAKGIPEPILSYIRNTKFTSWNRLLNLQADAPLRLKLSQQASDVVETELVSAGYEEIVFYPIRGWANETVGALCILRYIAKPVHKHELSSTLNAAQLVQIAVNKEFAERKLIKAKDQAEKNAKAKSQFLACMSHEIRTPMNGVLGMADLMLETDLNGEQREYVDTIKECGSSLLTVINDVLDLSKIEAGKFSLLPDRFNLGEKLERIENVLATQLKTKNISFILQVDPKIPQCVIADGGRLFQILINLVGNAIKFTPPDGAIWLFCRCNELSEGNASISFGVGDSGIGIAQEKQRQIFEAFSQADVTTTRDYGGTGLGLTIAAELVQMMGGDLQVTSQEGIGSIFHFTLTVPVPAAEILQSHKSVIDHSARKKLQILVAEDNLVNQKLIQRLLMKAGHTPTIACNGKEALNLYTKDKFDIILMDVQMPEMDGVTCAAKIRQEEIENGGHIPIIALTAHAMEGDREKFLSMGMDGYITKPIDINELYTTLYGVLR